MHGKWVKDNTNSSCVHASCCNLQQWVEIVAFQLFSAYPICGQQNGDCVTFTVKLWWYDMLQYNNGSIGHFLSDCIAWEISEWVAEF